MKLLTAYGTVCLALAMACSGSKESKDNDQAGGEGGDSEGGSGGQATGGARAGGGGGSSGGGSGGLAGASAGNGGAGGVAKPDAAVVDTVGDVAWDFETGAEGWNGIKVDTVVATSTAQKFRGTSSLAYNIDVTAAELAATSGADGGVDAGTDAGTDAGMIAQPERMLALTAMNTKLLIDTASGTTRPGWSGKMIKLRVYVAGDLKVGYFTLFAIGPPAAWKDSGNTTIVPNKWIELTLAAPVVAMKNPFDFTAFGIFMTGFKGPWKGTIYIDAVEAN